MSALTRAAAVAAVALAATFAATGPAAADHGCRPGERAYHLYDPLTGRELVAGCLPNTDSEPIVQDCPPGTSGTVIKLPLLQPIYFCEGPA